jgi:hypothetical protein
MDAERREAEAHRVEYLEGKREQRERYEAMIAKVEAWSTEAEGIRDFMLSQLRESMSFDCGGDYAPAIPSQKTPAEWLSERSAKLAKEISYYEQQRAEEIERTAGRNRWLKALRDSLPAPSPQEAKDPSHQAHDGE